MLIWKSLFIFYTCLLKCLFLSEIYLNCLFYIFVSLYISFRAFHSSLLSSTVALYFFGTLSRTIGFSSDGLCRHFFSWSLKSMGFFLSRISSIRAICIFNWSTGALWNLTFFYFWWYILCDMVSNSLLSRTYASPSVFFYMLYRVWMLINSLFLSGDESNDEVLDLWDIIKITIKIFKNYY